MAALRPIKYSYDRHRPENTLLYKLVNDNYDAFLRQSGDKLPEFVKKEFEAFLRCGILSYGFLRLKCEDCKHERVLGFSCKKRSFCVTCGNKRKIELAAHLVDRVLPVKPYRQWVISFPYQLRFLFASNPKVMSACLKIVNDTISSYYLKKAGLTKKSGAKTGAIALIQKFGGQLNLNLHFHIIQLEGVYAFLDEKPKFHTVTKPSQEEMESIFQKITTKILKYLTKNGYIEKQYDIDKFELGSTEGFDLLQAASITYYIADGPRKGKKLLTINPNSKRQPTSNLLINENGFSLHAEVSIKASDRIGLENLCRYVGRPAISQERLQTNTAGQVVYFFKKPWSDGTDRIVMEPLEFLQKLAALVVKPKVNLTRYLGIFSSNSKHRQLVVSDPPKKDLTGIKKSSSKYSMRWAEVLSRVYDIDIETCPDCGSKLKIIAVIQDQAVIEKILTHLGLDPCPPKPQQPRAPPEDITTSESTFYKAYDTESQLPLDW